MHHFPFHISDFALATQRFTPEQIGVFLALLMEYYKTEKPLPADVEELCFMAGAMSASGKKAVEFVLKRCFVLNSEGSHYHQRRADKELENYRKACRQNLYAIVCKHWEKVNRGYPKPTFDEFTTHTGRYYDVDTKRLRALTGRNDMVLVPEGDGNTIPPPDASQPRTNNQEPISNNQGTPVVPTGTATIEAVAEAIYALYPKKVGRTAALKSIVKVLRGGTILELELQERVRAYAEATAQWSKVDCAYIPNPSTWFNEGRFMDDPATWIREPDLARKKEGGAGLFADEGGPPKVAKDTSAPVGWQGATVALYGELIAWAMLGEGQQGEVREWLEKEKTLAEGSALTVVDGGLPRKTTPKSIRPFPARMAFEIADEAIESLEREKKGGAKRGFECPEPCDWREVCTEIYGGMPSPETWEGVADVARREIVARVEARKRAGVPALRS